jgi:hypothetical protein
MIERRIETLNARRIDLHEALAAELKRPRPDSEIVRMLKVQKLRLRDEIAVLARAPSQA